MSSEIPRHAPEMQTDIESVIIPYGDIIDEKIRNRQLGENEVGSTINQDRVSGRVNYVGAMNVLAPRDVWQGNISAEGEYALEGGQRDIYYTLLENSIVAVMPGSQRGCIDGRWLFDEIALGPKTAGGTFGDAMRLMLASRAVNPDGQMTYEAALKQIRSIEEKLGYKPGGHDLGQCGAFKFAAHSFSMVADRKDDVADGVRTFFGAVGHEYSDEIQEDLANSSGLLKKDLGIIIPSIEAASSEVLRQNPKACPELADTHKELAVVVFTQPGATLDNNRLIQSTKQAFGVERQAFAYNWDFHLAVADELGGRLGEYYLQSVASQDIGALSQLTDGTLDIVSFNPAK